MDWGEMILFPLMSPGGTRAFTRLNPVAMFSLALFSFLSGVGVVWLFLLLAEKGRFYLAKTGRWWRREVVEAPVYRSKSGKNDKKIVNFVVSGNCFCVWGWDEGVEVPPAALRVNHPTLRRCQVANHASGGLCVGVMR